MAPSTSSGSYQVETVDDQPATKTTASIAPPPILPSSLNINELFQKLVATGIVASKEPINKQPNLPVIPKVKRALEMLKPVSFSKPATLKTRQSQLYEILYNGMQCSSCGMRFPPEQTIHYSQHLDWHFRQNRKGKKNIRVAASRRWYYSLADWKNYEEIEDLEEREKNYFDQLQTEGGEDDQDGDVEIPSVIADPDVQVRNLEVKWVALENKI